MYYVHEKDLICPKCTRKFTVSWKEWREIFTIFYNEEETYWFKCPSCKHEFGDEKRREEDKKKQKVMIPIVVSLLLVILIVIGFLIKLIYFK